jgi:hypothetical protein
LQCIKNLITEYPDVYDFVEKNYITLKKNIDLENDFLIFKYFGVMLYEIRLDNGWVGNILVKLIEKL